MYLTYKRIRYYCVKSTARLSDLKQHVYYLLVLVAPGMVSGDLS